MYKYTKTSNYSYAPFQGKEFLNEYQNVRKKSMKKSLIDDKELDSKARLSKHYLDIYEKTKNLKALNFALKINDEICSKEKITMLCYEVLFDELRLVYDIIYKEDLI